MKIGIDATNLAPGGGLTGLVNYLYEWVKPNYSAELIVFVSRLSVKQAIQKNCPSLEVIEFSVGVPSPILFLRRKYFFSVFIEKYRLDVVFTTNSLSDSVKIPQVVHHRNMLWFNNKENIIVPYRNLVILGRIRQYFWRKAGKKAVYSAAANVFVSQHLQEIALADNPDMKNYYVVHHGLSRIAKETEWDETARPDSGQLVAVTSDNLHKNNTLLIHCVRMLRSRKPGVDWKLLIVGRGSYQNDKALAVELGVMECIDFIGFKDQEDMSKIYADSLCLVFPSLTESFGNPPLEAMARGCPVVASNRAAMPEICGHGAQLLDPMSVEDFVDAVLSLHNSESLRNYWAQAGLSRSRDFSWIESSRRLMNIIRNNTKR